MTNKASDNSRQSSNSNGNTPDDGNNFNDRGKNDVGSAIKPYNQLAQELKGTGLQAHHLIEQRFAKVLGVDPKTMQSIAMTPAEHQAFTNAWRGQIEYGAGTANATRESVMRAAQEVYKNYPAILQALGF